VAFLDVRPLSPGHTLVVPITEVDQWTDLEPELAAHLVGISHAVGVAQRGVFAPERIGLVIAGFEVPHVHVHVFPAASMAVFDFANANTRPDPAALDEHAAALRAALRLAGHGTSVPS
jgi:histidine triad (HIT) family protein